MLLFSFHISIKYGQSLRLKSRNIFTLWAPWHTEKMDLLPMGIFDILFGLCNIKNKKRNVKGKERRLFLCFCIIENKNKVENMLVHTSVRVCMCL